jgi:DNA (cytosine-5)-methyltransferase 3A
VESEGVYRRLSPVEVERLQTVPDDYTSGVSDTQRYMMLGNGWTIDVIAHIFSFIK